MARAPLRSQVADDLAGVIYRGTHGVIARHAAEVGHHPGAPQEGMLARGYNEVGDPVQGPSLFQQFQVLAFVRAIKKRCCKLKTKLLASPATDARYRAR